MSSRPVLSTTRFLWSFITVALVAAIAVGITTAALSMWAAAPAGTPGCKIVGPYTLTGNSGLTLNFTNCTIVTAHWTITVGGPANFTVWKPIVLPETNCSGPAVRENTSACAAGNCINYGALPVCAEFGLSGSCSFRSIVHDYFFGLWGSPAYWRTHGDEVVTFDLALT
jgi:hypothetical protein